MTRYRKSCGRRSEVRFGRSRRHVDRGSEDAGGRRVYGLPTAARLVGSRMVATRARKTTDFSGGCPTISAAWSGRKSPSGFPSRWDCGMSTPLPRTMRWCDLPRRIRGGRIHYTLDGTDPDERSTLYQSPLRDPVVNTDRKGDAIVVTQAGRQRGVWGDLAPAAAEPAVPTRTEGPAWRSRGSEDASTPGIWTVRLRPRPAAPTSMVSRRSEREADDGVIFEGYVNVSAEGYYQFGSVSDDGSRL